MVPSLQRVAAPPVDIEAGAAGDESGELGHGAVLAERAGFDKLGLNGWEPGSEAGRSSGIASDFPPRAFGRVLFFYCATRGSRVWRFIQSLISRSVWPIDSRAE